MEQSLDLQTLDLQLQTLIFHFVQEHQKYAQSLIEGTLFEFNIENTRGALFLLFLINFKPVFLLFHCFALFGSKILHYNTKF